LAGGRMGCADRQRERYCPGCGREKAPSQSKQPRQGAEAVPKNLCVTLPFMVSVKAVPQRGTRCEVAA
jgi:hypothetical protein